VQSQAEVWDMRAKLIILSAKEHPELSWKFVGGRIPYSNSNIETDKNQT
jgi:hypothetical protein